MAANMAAKTQNYVYRSSQVRYINKWSVESNISKVKESISRSGNSAWVLISKMAVNLAPKHRNLYIWAHILLLAAILASILKNNVPILLPLRESDLLTLTVSNLTLHLLFKLNLELRYAYFVLADILESNTRTLLVLRAMDSFTLKLLNSTLYLLL